MSISRSAGAFTSLTLCGLLAVACGSSSDEFADGRGDDVNHGATAGGGFVGPSSGEEESSAAGDDGPACAAQEVAAARKPVKLLVVLDQSGSMGDGSQPSHDKTKKWIPVTTALKSFLSEPQSTGIEASMRLFPTSTGGASFRCNSDNYETPNVAMTALPNADPFSAVLVDTPTFSSTPTRAVLRATVKDATAVAAANPDAKVAIVLITDGEPAGCQSTDMGNDVDDVAAEVSGTKATIPTYVIGVGSVANLDTIANAGGPRGAFIVSVDDPTATQAELLAAVNEIRGAALSCDVDIPPLPAGETLDPKKVNVNYTPTGQAATQLAYDQSCASPDAGWRYDDETNPTQVVLCPTACATAKADPQAKLGIELGCVTRTKLVQ